MAPYNALNYGLGLSSCSYRAYVEGMVGALPYTCLAVYAGMLISSVEEIDSLLTHTSTGWYCVYALLGVLCVFSFAALIRYTAAEMRAAVAATAGQSSGDGGGIGVGGGGNGPLRSGAVEEGEGAFGDLPPDSTLFGTFTTREGGSEMEAGGGEEMQTFDESAVARLPLLGRDPRRNDGGEGVRRNQAARLGSLVDI